ncbi:MAG: DUF1565 domain-containing protein [Patescibacteria group bacterium]
MRKIFVIFCLFFFTSSVYATTYYVSNSGNNTNTGLSSDNPWKTITFALSSVAGGDTIHLASGTYSMASGETFPLDMNLPVTLEGSGLLGASASIIRSDPSVAQIAIKISSGGVRIENLRIDGVGALTGSSAIGYFALTRPSSPAIVSNVYIDGQKTARIGVFLEAYAWLKIRNACIVNCLGNGMSYTDNCSFEVVNCTIASNEGTGISLRLSSTGIIMNSILAYNQQALLLENDFVGDCLHTYNNYYANVDSNTTPESTGEFTLDPSFVDFDGFRLQSKTEGYANHSYAIDGGDPTSIYSQEPSPNGSRINMGWNGNKTSAELSYPGPKTYYVSAENGNNTNIGLHPSYPWKTITYALTKVSTGDSVFVSGGTYDRVVNGETFPLTIATGILLSGEGESATIEASLADGSDLGSIVYMYSRQPVTVEGFTIKLKENSSAQAAIRISCPGDTAVLCAHCQNNNIIGNVGQVANLDNAVIVELPNPGITTNLRINNNLIARCTNGISLLPSTTQTTTAAVISNNTIDQITQYCIEKEENVFPLLVKNNITTNSGVGIKIGLSDIYSLCQYNDAYGNTNNYNIPISAEGAGNVVIDPYYVSSTGGLWRLQSIPEGQANQSPCIDAGNPSDDWSMEPDPNGSRINMGYYGGLSNAELSYSTTTTTTTTTTATTTTATTTTNTSTITTTTTSTTTTTRAILLPGGQIVVNPVVWNRTNPLRMAYRLTADQATRLVIFSSSGTIVFNNQYAAGSNGGRIGYNEINWDGKNPSGNCVGNGVYVVQLIAGSERIAKGYITVMR